MTWSDFQGVPKPDGFKLAATQGKITAEHGYWDDDLPVFEIKAYFLKDDSWTITDSALTLEHEQIHFDILELHTRLIRKSFDSLNYIGETDFQVYQEVFKNVLDKSDALNDTYDDDVRLDRTRQEYWKEFIWTKLQQTEEYYINPD